MRKKPLVSAVFALTLCGLSSPGYALTGLNQCGAGTKPPAEIRCSQNELLLGYRDATGPCLWVCCPPNSDGKTYNCTGKPTPSEYFLNLEKVTPEPWQGVFTPGPAFEKQ